MRVYDVAGESVVYYKHHEGVYFIANLLHDENCTALLTSLVCNFKFYNVSSHLLSTFILKSANSNGVFIKNFKSLKEIKEAVKTIFK
jgi:hypothetical protein